MLAYLGTFKASFAPHLKISQISMSLADWNRRVRQRVEADEKAVVVSTPTQKVAKLNNRLRALAKKMKIQNPVHLGNYSLGTVFPSVSLTGTLFDVSSLIAQGDDYNNRFSSQVYLRRLNMRGVFLPGTAASNPAIARITVFRGQAGLSFATNLASSYSPIVTGTSLQVYYDKHFTIPGSYTNPGFAVNINISLKIPHKQKFSGTAAASQTGDCIYVIVQSGVAAGTSAPTLTGVMEVFFDPM